MQESPTKDMKFDICAIPFEKSIKPLITKPGEAKTHVYTTVLETYPELKNLKSFLAFYGSDGLPPDKVIRYIILLYSEDSILNKKPLAQLEERKYKSANLAGFKRDENSGDFRVNITEELFLLNNEMIVDMVLEYLTYQFNDVWTELCIIQQELEEYRRIRVSPTNAQHDKDLITALEKKDKLRTSCENMISSIKSYTDIFFGDHLDLKGKSKKKRVTLESMARNQ